MDALRRWIHPSSVIRVTAPFGIYRIFSLSSETPSQSSICVDFPGMKG